MVAPWLIWGTSLSADGCNWHTTYGLGVFRLMGIAGCQKKTSAPHHVSRLQVVASLNSEDEWLPKRPPSSMRNKYLLKLGTQILRELCLSYPVSPKIHTRHYNNYMQSVVLSALEQLWHTKLRSPSCENDNSSPKPHAPSLEPWTI